MPMHSVLVPASPCAVGVLSHFPRCQAGPSHARIQCQQPRRSVVIRANLNSRNGSDPTVSTSSASQQQQDPSMLPSTSSPSPAAAVPATPPAASSSSSSGNTGLAGGAVAAGVALFLATRLLTGGPSIAALEQEAIPLDVALGNGRPTVVEFYASWWVNKRIFVLLHLMCSMLHPIRTLLTTQA